MIHAVLPRRRVLLAAGLAALALPGGPRAQQARGPQQAREAEPLARLELAVPGVVMEVLGLVRLANHPVVELRFSLLNDSQRPVSLHDLGISSTDPGLIANIVLLDLPNGTGYRIGRVSSRNLASLLPNPLQTLQPGDRRDGLWAWFGAPPAPVTRLALNVPGAALAVDLPLRAP
jgi:hypothetical protein